MFVSQTKNELYLEQKEQEKEMKTNNSGCKCIT